MAERTEYDKMMQERFNPLKEKYNTPPFPGYRTPADVAMQKKWCAKCPKYYNPVENYAPLNGFRTKFDMELQKKWCGGCTSFSTYLP